ncbi:MAG: cytochrome c biogenesis protein ResB [Verrucomicrobiales bacterium]
MSDQTTKSTEENLLQRVFNFFASFGLACVVLTLLCWLTFLGTINMPELGLYRTGNKYFESWFFMQDFGPLKVPQPGGMLLMVLLFLNLLCGALIRARKNWRTPGMLIAHGGIMFMLVAGLVSFTLTREGSLILWEDAEFGATYEQAEGGVKITAVDPALAAGKVGLQVDDLLIAVTEPGSDGEFGGDDDERLVIADYGPDRAVRAAEQFTAGLAGEKVKLSISRGGEEKEIEVNYSGRAGNEAFNLMDWSIEVGEYTGDTLPENVMVIPPAALTPLLKRGSKRVFYSEDLPFEIEISRYLQNCMPQPASEADPGKNAVGGFYLREVEVDPEEERNIHGANVRILPKGGGEAIEESLLFGDYPDRGWTAPLTVEVDGRRWAVNLTKQRMSLPFKIRLEDFTKLEHPGTMKAKEYMSDVTKLNKDGTGETSLIEMNKPLRSDGFTVYQASWGPEGAAEGQPLFTSLAVSRNPADQWPKYSCYIVSLGLLIHFLQKLFKYLSRTQRKHKREAATAAPAANQ